MGWISKIITVKKINENVSNMPTLFPVVDPKQQKFDIKKLKTEFKFNR